jgi:hypothetical protein
MVTRRLNIPVLAPNPNRNFFDGTRPGHAVLRPADLLALRLELRNLTVAPGQPPRLKKAGDGAATLIVHFPPQSISEETFFERPPPGTANQPPPRPTPGKPEPGGVEDPTGPPVRARIAGESRLAFDVPDGFDVPYTLEGVLAAMESLPLTVAANARPPGPSAPRLNPHRQALAGATRGAIELRAAQRTHRHAAERARCAVAAAGRRRARPARIAPGRRRAGP